MIRVAQKRLHRAATLADVGRAAGVSTTSVSRVLNHSSTTARVSRATHDRIRAAAAKLGYRANRAAVGLVKQCISTLGMACVCEGGELSGYFLEVFNGVRTAASVHGQNVSICAMRDWKSGAARMRDLCDGRIDGLILLAPTLRRMDATLPPHPPIVSIQADSGLPGVQNIDSEEERGARVLVEYLIGLGHRRILHLAGPEGLVGSRRRVRGYKQAMENAGVPFQSELLATAGSTTALGRKAMTDWLRRHPGRPLPHAVFCANDRAAIGCLQALAGAGLRVPEDISVAGFDDTPEARSIVPSLTTVHQPLREMGARAVEVLLARIDDPSPTPRAIPKPEIFPTKLVLRASVGPPPGIPRLAPSR